MSCYYPLLGYALRMSSYSAIAAAIQQHPQSQRMQKLLFATINKNWENRLDVIAHTSLEQQLQKLTQVYTSQEQMRTAIFNVVNTLNKRDEYAALGEEILNYLASAYAQGEATQIVVKPASTVSLYPESVYDSFAVRAEVMKYANPLRAKVLLFALLDHPFTDSEADHIQLRAKELDQLLGLAFQKFTTLAELETHLIQIAQTEHEDSLQAAYAIIRALKPFYAQRRPEQVVNWPWLSNTNYEAEDRRDDSTYQIHLKRP